MKKYLIYCCLLICFMLSLCCVQVNGASGEMYPGGYSGSNFWTTSDNLKLEVLDFGDEFIYWYNDSLLNFPYVLNFSDLNGSYYVGADNMERTYEITALDNYYTSVSTSSSIRRLKLEFGQSFLPISSENATTIRFFLDSLEDDSYEFKYTISLSGIQLQIINDEWIQVPFNYSNSVYHEFDSMYPVYDFNYITEFGLDLQHYSNNSILNITDLTIIIDNIDEYEYSIDYQYIYYRKLNSSLTNVDDWKGNLDWDFSDFGTTLLRGVTNFLGFEIYPGFSLLDLLYLIIGIPLLIAILRLFLGG